MRPPIILSWAKIQGGTANEGWGEKEKKGEKEEKVVHRAGEEGALGSWHRAGGLPPPAPPSRALSEAKCCFPGTQLKFILSAPWLLSRRPPALSLGVPESLPAAPEAWVGPPGETFERQRWVPKSDS